jgi:hypothetical protein
MEEIKNAIGEEYEKKLYGITNARTVVLFRRNLNQMSKDKKFDEITLVDFTYSDDPRANSFKIPAMMDIIMFVDIMGRTKILKNRWGADGEVKK